jgi:hypothetical protein
VRHEDIPDMSNPKTTKAVLEGDKLIMEVLKGGYNVHPVPPPNSVHKESITKRYETGRMRIDKLLTLGYTTSADPRKTGTKLFPNPPNKPGITKKNIISNPCKVMLTL